MQKQTMSDSQVDAVISGLRGYRGLQVGKKYYIFTVTFDYIGVVDSVDEHCFTLSAESAHIVTNAGSDAEAVTKILAGKGKPEVWEKVGRPITVQFQVLEKSIPFPVKGEN